MKIDKRHIKCVYKDDIYRYAATGMHVLSHVKAEHFHPISFEKMRVNFATALLSDAVIDALEEANKEEFKGTIKYLEFCTRFRNFFTTTKRMGDKSNNNATHERRRLLQETRVIEQ